mmetsp:Transcript_5432/g.9158  ORF Transcript_5432/g.9158 Transcript_5432/m.9158 type:complete len:126 (+) Transcript_5432:1749-2126(+)
MSCSVAKETLVKLCLLYGLHQLYLNPRSCYDSGYFHAQTKTPYSQLLIDAIKQLNREIRPKAISIVESIGVDDLFLVSAVGNSYGDIYETHLEWAKNSRLNHTKRGDAIPDGYMENIMPIMQGKL